VAAPRQPAELGQAGIALGEELGLVRPHGARPAGELVGRDREDEQARRRSRRVDALDLRRWTDLPTRRIGDRGLPKTHASRQGDEEGKEQKPHHAYPTLRRSIETALMRANTGRPGRRPSSEAGLRVLAARSAVPWRSRRTSRLEPSSSASSTTVPASTLRMLRPAGRVSAIETSRARTRMRTCSPSNASTSGISKAPPPNSSRASPLS